MTMIVAPPQVTGQARHDWAVLQAETAGAPTFEPGQADPLPGPARRWVRHAIAPGTPLLRSVVLTTHGQIRLGGWHLFGVECGREITFDGFTIPAWVQGGWWLGTERWADGEFIRFSVEDALFH